MLEPDIRRSLHDALRPDPGFSLDCAIGTTFSLDLLALLTAQLAFAPVGLGEDEAAQKPGSLKLFNALQRNAERIHLFCQIGRIHVPTEHHSLFAFLESAIIQVRPRQKGCVFHPKVWVLRYRSSLDGSASVRYRVLCLSRNLTFDRSWDTALALDGEPGRGPQRKQMLPLSRFVAALPHLAVQPPRQSAIEAAALIASELPYVDLVLPPGVTDLQFHVAGLTRKTTWPFAMPLERIAVVSPFVEDRLLERLADATRVSFLVARTDELQALTPATRGRIERTYTMIDEALPEQQDQAETASADRGPVGIESSLQGLHGKLYIGEHEDDAIVWTGSANASSAAFHGNVEFLTQLTGPRQKLGIDAFLWGQTGDGFGRLLAAFVPALGNTPAPPTATLEKLLESTRDAISGSQWRGRVTRNTATTFDLSLAPVAACTLSPEVHVHCHPSTGQAGQGILLAPGATEVLRFEALPIDALTTFFVFRLAAQRGEESATLSFALNVPLDGLPPDREAHILHALLQDHPGGLLQLIWLLLQYDAEDGFAGPVQPGHDNGSSFGQTLARDKPPLFEMMVRALHRDPLRIDAVAGVITHLPQRPAAEAEFWKDFDQIWKPIFQARQSMTTSHLDHETI